MIEIQDAGTTVATINEKMKPANVVIKDEASEELRTMLTARKLDFVGGGETDDGTFFTTIEDVKRGTADWVKAVHDRMYRMNLDWVEV